MGRVRRYKKIKAIDPFAKKQKAELDTVHDEPPQDFQDRAKKSANRSNKIEMNMMRQYRKIARETIVIPADASQHVKKEKEKDKKPQIQKRQDGESMKQFKKRIRQETRLTLRDEFKKNSSSAQKKKARLKDRKLARKAPKKGEALEMEYERFGASESGKVRASDEQHPQLSFGNVEKIKFGERVDCPPDFRHVYSMAGARKTGLISSAEEQGASFLRKKRPQQQQRDGEEHDAEEREDGGARKKRRQQGEDEEERQTGQRQVRKVGKEGGDDPMLKMVMERERVRVVEAYKELQKKRREEKGRNFSTLE